MKKSRKFLKVLSVSAIAAMMAAATVPMTAFAAVDTTTEQQYILPAAPKGETYTVYKVANAEVDGGTYSYSVNSKDLGDDLGFETIITNGTGDNKGNLMYNGTAISSEDASTAQTIAKALAGVVSNEVSIESIDTADGEGNPTSSEDRTIKLKAGYYLITCSATTASPILLTVRSDDPYTTTPRSLEAKTNDITVDKSIETIGVGNDGHGYGGTVSADKNKGQGAIGATVNYKITTTIPKYASNVTKMSHNFTIVDTPEEGININKDVIVKVDGAGVTAGENTYTLTYDATTKGFTVVFAEDYVLEKDGDGAWLNQGKTVEISFTATIDTDATTGTNSNDNKVVLTYDNDFTTTGAPDPNDDHKGEKDETVVIFTTELDVTKKFNNNDSDGDKTATFKLFTYDANTATKGSDPIDELTTSSSDNILEFKGLAVGTYILQETSTPDGYKSADDLIFTITGDVNSTNPVFVGSFAFDNDDKITETSGIGKTTINNLPGQILPGTGGVGTTIFTIAGLGTIVVAGTALTIYLKKRRSEEE